MTGLISMLLAQGDPSGAPSGAAVFASIVGTLGTLGGVGLGTWLLWRESAKRRQIVEAPQRTALAQGERRVFEAFATLKRGIKSKFKEGRLILTDSRLVFTNLDETEIAASIERKQVVEVRVESGMFRAAELRIIRTGAQESGEKELSWTIPSLIPAGSRMLGLGGSIMKEHSCAAEDLAKRVERWRQDGFGNIATA